MREFSNLLDNPTLIRRWYRSGIKDDESTFEVKGDYSSLYILNRFVNLQH